VINRIISEKNLTKIGSEYPSIESKIKVSYYFNENFTKLGDNLRSERHLLGINSMDTDKLMINFLKYLAMRLPDRNSIFCIKSGAIGKKRLRNK